VTGYISRLFLFKTAYRIEFDFRNIIYEHLTRMSFSFYDRVQSGQLISRANSDIRSVQMYMTFAPSSSCSARSPSWPSGSCCRSTSAGAHLDGDDALRLPRRRTDAEVAVPVSWLIQSRLADVATIVDENVNGVRVVKSFAAEDQQLKALSRAATKVQWGLREGCRPAGPLDPRHPEPSPARARARAPLGGWMVIHNPRDVGNILAFNVYLLMMQAPFMMLGMLIMMGQRAGRLGLSHL